MPSIKKLLEIMASLRDPQAGCPWDLRQDFASIAPYTVEEAYEVADAISRNDPDGLCDELGDLLFQVVFHARMAEEQGLFDFDAVAKGISAKMERRHPHVFGTPEERAAGAIEGSWEEIKALERDAAAEDDARVSALDGVAVALPALKRASKLGNRAAATGFDWPDPDGVVDKVREELSELAEAREASDQAHMVEELGDLLFSVANLARHLNIDPEQALDSANRKFERRFRQMEQDLSEAGLTAEDLDLEALEARWRAAKASTTPGHS